MIRTIPVAAELLGLVAAGQPDPVMVWEDVAGRRALTDRQEKDPESGELVWTAYLLPTAAERPEVLQVRTTAPHQPVLTMFGPVAVDNLTANVRVDKSGKLAQYWAATSVRDGGHASRRNGHEQKAEAQA